MSFPIRTALRKDALPSGRLGYDLAAPSLLLHTIQSEEAFEELLSTGRILPDPARTEPLFTEAYAWMLGQMELRLPTRGNGAFWLWAKIQRRDLLDICRQSQGNILLTCRIPRDRVLLSHFHDWHQVLNTSLNVLSLPYEDDDHYARRLDEILDDFWDRVKAAGVEDEPVSVWPEPLRAEIHASWQFIFEPGNYGREACWQATVHELCAEDITDAVRFEN